MSLNQSRNQGRTTAVQYFFLPSILFVNVFPPFNRGTRQVDQVTINGQSSFISPNKLHFNGEPSLMQTTDIFAAVSMWVINIQYCNVIALSKQRGSKGQLGCLKWGLVFRLALNLVWMSNKKVRVVCEACLYSTNTGWSSAKSQLYCWIKTTLNGLIYYRTLTYIQ